MQVWTHFLLQLWSFCIRSLLYKLQALNKGGAKRALGQWYDRVETEMDISLEKIGRWGKKLDITHFHAPQRELSVKALSLVLNIL
ncbi:uncharacterized protein LOC141693066 isoform X2 [Apium graveolens]|uniref:uncharacterized protein LOC141693066 isoform X2 n=1 Tax=Apium graveolens TaxID=4045 RepID=UPI003D7BF7CA